MPAERTTLPFPVRLRTTARRIEGGATALEGSGALWWATTTPDGPASLRLAVTDDRTIAAETWGDGAAWLAAQVPRLVGVEDVTADRFAPDHPFLQAQIAARGIPRLGRTDRVFEALLGTIVAQKVQGKAAARSLWLLTDRFGAPAPGPTRLRLPPAAAVLAKLAGWQLHQCGLERRRADTIIRAAKVANRLEEAGSLGVTVLWDRLVSLAGIGPWTAAAVCDRALGDPDSVQVGDFHLPNWVAFALAGEARASDERMLELLAPYAGHRARVVDLVERSGLGAPRYGPRLDFVPVDRIDRAASWNAARGR